MTTPESNQSWYGIGPWTNNDILVVANINLATNFHKYLILVFEKYR